MKANNFNLTDYFQRIAYPQTKNTPVDIKMLTEMMRQQLFTVPFENLDVQAGKVISLLPEDIVEKIVYQRRGGYCYEVNGLFAMALEALGVSYQFVAARPMFYPVRRPKTHMVVVVRLEEERWLFDLGFGSYGIRAPMSLTATNVDVVQDHDVFMLEHDQSTDTFTLKAKLDGAWANQYAFDLSPQEWIDFAPANYLNSTHPDAVFVQKLLVVLHHVDGRNILFGDQFKQIQHGQVSLSTVNKTDIELVLEKTFGLPCLSII